MEGCFERTDIAFSFLARMRGLMFARSVDPAYAMVFPNCRSVHTCFMKVPIDVIYLDSTWGVIGWETVGPWRLPKAPAGTRNIVECAAGEAARLGVELGGGVVIDFDNTRDL